jgi:hypothetical protein
MPSNGASDNLAPEMSVDSESDIRNVLGEWHLGRTALQVLGGIESRFILNHPAFHVLFGLAGITPDISMRFQVMGHKCLHPRLEGFPLCSRVAQITFERFHAILLLLIFANYNAKFNN